MFSLAIFFSLTDAFVVTFFASASFRITLKVFQYFQLQLLGQEQEEEEEVGEAGIF